mmetsp:Transcript_50365/g.108545  ORF Transcript_50365/g.108545 Transcript_50365/m.108545 type:complete len:116 (-) Transcript_50365:1331-1678(-)
MLKLYSDPEAALPREALRHCLLWITLPLIAEATPAQVWSQNQRSTIGQPKSESAPLSSRFKHNIDADLSAGMFFLARAGVVTKATGKTRPAGTGGVWQLGQGDPEAQWHHGEGVV